MSDLFLLVMQVLRDHASDGLQAELEDHKRQWNSLMSFRVIQNPVWNDAEDAPRVVHASGLVLSEHAIAVEVPRSDGTIRMKFHSWLVPMVGRCKISDLVDCQMEFLGVAETLEVDASTMEWIPDQEDTIRVNLCVCDRQWGYYNTQSYVSCRICGWTNLQEEVERMTRHREFYESGASRNGRLRHGNIEGPGAARWLSEDSIRGMAFRNPNATVYFDFVDGGDKYSAQLDRIMSLRGVVIPNRRDDGDVWVMLDRYSL